CPATLPRVQPMAVWAAVPVWIIALVNLVVFFVSLFLILLILIQRGKGGGLAGAFGGMGGSSAFGSRARDTFTRSPLVTAAVWILLIMIMIKRVRPPIDAPLPPDTLTAPADNLPEGS